MNKLTKLMLASAVMVTSGFADPGDTILGASDDVVELNGLFGDTNYVANDGGAINVLSDTTIPVGRIVTLESGGVGTIAGDVVLSNEGLVYMRWDDNDADRGLVTGDGTIDQIFVEGSCETIRGNFDGQGYTDWYVYVSKDTEFWAEHEFYHKTVSDQKGFPDDYTGWYISNGIYGEGIKLDSDNAEKFDKNIWRQDIIGRKVGSIVIYNVERLYCRAAGSAVLDSDSTDLNGTTLNGKTPKVVSFTETCDFFPPIPSTIANVTLNGGTDLLGSPANDAFTDASSMENYFSKFGVSFKRADKYFSSLLTYGTEERVIDAIEKGSADEAVLLNLAPAICVDYPGNSWGYVEVVTNLHNIGYTGGVTFTGVNVLTLSGNNNLLEKVTANCPVKISGANAMPKGSTFNNGLTIAENVTTPEGETKVYNGFKVESGKKFIVKGKLIVGNAG